MSKDRDDRGIYRRGTVWWICYSQGGHKYRESSRSSRKKVARDLLKKRLGEIGSGRLIGPNAEKVTLADLGAMLFADYEARGLKSLVRMRQHIKHLTGYFGEHARALDITWDAATRYIAHRRQEMVDPVTGAKVPGAKPATIKGELGALGRAFTIAYRAGKLPQRPPLPGLKVDNARSGFFTDGEVAALLPHLPAYLRPLIETAYLTGWRRGELCALRWVQVDWDAGVIRLERGTTKTGEPRSLCFTAHPRLAAILTERRASASRIERERGVIVNAVFHRGDGRAVRGWYYDAWKTACEKAGFPGRVVHDFRRSCVRNLVTRAGVSERVAMSITGHKSRSVFDRYHIVSDSDQADAMRKLAKVQGAVAPASAKVVAMRGREAAGSQSVHKRGGTVRASRYGATSEVASPTRFELVLPP